VGEREQICSRERGREGAGLARERAEGEKDSPECTRAGGSAEPLQTGSIGSEETGARIRYYQQLKLLAQQAKLLVVLLAVGVCSDPSEL
jgi:hypothetical protein